MKNYKLNKECYKFYKENIKNKIVSEGIGEDLFYAFEELYNNVNFQEVYDGATKRNNALLFDENNITFLNYSHKHFKSKELNPSIDKKKIKLFAKMSRIMVKENIFKNCVDFKLITHISKRSKISVRYKLLINDNNYRHIKRFMTIYKMSKQFVLD